MGLSRGKFLNRDDYRLPRYTFRKSNVGCGGVGHSDECLCDVRLDNGPAPLFVGQPLMFGQLALRELDADQVSDRNIVEFASILLGCYDEFLHCPLPEYTPYEDYDMPASTTMIDEAKPTGGHRRQAGRWQKRSESPVITMAARRRGSKQSGASPQFLQLDQETQEHLIFHWRADSPWSVVKHLAAGMGLEEQGWLRSYYMEKAREYRANKKWRLAKAARKVSCETR